MKVSPTISLQMVEIEYMEDQDAVVSKVEGKRE